MTPVRDKLPPILLWALTHPTLVKAEVPLLREAGFEVVVQEPTTHVRAVEVIEYPDVSDYPNPANDARIVAARDLGSRVRLGPRGGLVTAGESAIINWAFDAIMTDDERIVEQRLPRWFHGAVLFRDYGNVPGTLTQDRGPRRGHHANIVGVPILSGLEATRFERSLPRVHTLGTVVPQPPAKMKRVSAGHAVVSIFVAGLESEREFLPWLTAFRSALPSDAEIRVFGGHESLTSDYQALGVKPIGRLPDAEYWALFAAADLWVYPHQERLHSHYIPLEAISLGIPCIMTAQTAVAGECRSAITANSESCGIVANRHGLGPLAARLLQSPDERQQVVARQRELLRPFSRETVLDQARALVEIVTEIGASRRRPTQPCIRAQDTGPPSATELKSALTCSIPSPVVVSASSLAISWPWRQLALPRSRAVSDPHSQSPRLTQWLVRPGPDVIVPVGALSHAAGVRTAFRVDCEISKVPAAPVMLEVFDPDGRRAVIPWRTERCNAGSVILTGTVDVDPDQVVAIRVVSALAPRGLRLGEIRVSRAQSRRPGSARESAGHATIARKAMEGDAGASIPLWFAGWSSRGKGRSLPRITGGHLSVVRFSLDLLCDVASTDSWSMLFDSPPTRNARRGGAAAILVTRGPSNRSLRLLCLRLGPLTIRRPAPVPPDAPLWGLGTPRGIMGLIARRTTI